MFEWLILLLVVVPLLILVLLNLQYWWGHRRILSAASQLPCPPTYPLVGNALFFTGGINSITKIIFRFMTQFKGLFCLWVGPVPVFVVSDPADVQTILKSSNTLERDDVYNFLQPFMGNGLLTAPVSIWKKYRRLIKPVLHTTNVELFLPEFNEVSRNLSKELGCGRPVDPREGLFNVAVDAVLGTVLRGWKFTNNDKPSIHFLVQMVGQLFTYRLFKDWLHIDWIFKYIYRTEMKLAFEYTNACKEQLRENWKKEETKRKSLADADHSNNQEYEVRQNIVDIAWEHPPSKYEDHDWIDEFATIIAGATDDVIAATSYVLITLANYPEAQARIRSEIEGVMGDSRSDVSLTDIEAMPYLRCVILETMRLHGIFPVILRRATKDVTLNKSSSNFTFPMGSRILIPLHGMGWDPARFPEPHKFLPERFLDSTEVDRNFLPFSGGPRGCPGKNYAMLLIRTVLVHLLRKYHLTSPLKLEDIEYEMRVVMISKSPLPIMFEPITS